jgi:serine/threonine protein phosphatase PrpC/serine/threonine protein kinase
MISVITLYAFQLIYVCQFHNAINAFMLPQTSRRRRLFGKFSSWLKNAVTDITSTTIDVPIGDPVGSGSYGTVHRSENPNWICKRAWTKQELEANGSTRTEERCKHYFQVELHCFRKMPPCKYISHYLDTRLGNDGQEWMVFEMLTDKDGDKPAMSLEDVLEVDWQRQHGDFREEHHLLQLQDALGLDHEASFGDTLDIVLQSLLEAISFIHSQGIVHRDLKPANLLVSGKEHCMVVIDFGSAADMEPISQMFPFGKRRIGLEDDSVAISPIYAAPELYVKPDRAPFAFDVYSLAMIFCQLLFNYLDIRTDAAFLQQLKDVHYNLDSWLSRELSSKVRPAGLEEALRYLQERPGLWGVLTRMVQADPERRISSKDALIAVNFILGKESNTVTLDDGYFFESVLRTIDECEVPDEKVNFVTPRPLHFVASFQRGEPLGLLLSEAGDDLEIEPEFLNQWKVTTANAKPGDVFVMGIVPNSQASEIGIFEIGDQLDAVGNIPVMSGGFERAVQLIQNQPKLANYVTLQFSRSSLRQSQSTNIPSNPETTHARIIDEGAWSSLGRRRVNEDSFVLHDIFDADKESLLAGVFDGHGGRAAAQTASQLMPSLFTKELSKASMTSRQALESAWEETCQTYRSGCDEMGECLAEYDEQDGILLASTGSQDLISGTTASVVSIHTNELTILNCGDSRTLQLDMEGNILFETVDHNPESEMERFQREIMSGLDYSLPECSFSQWRIPCGDMKYAVARSLEGSFATSKGIISTPDVTSLRPSPGTILIATDGLWEVCGAQEVAKVVTRMRDTGVDAGNVAKVLCSLAVQKGSSDNVSVVIIYLT